MGKLFKHSDIKIFSVLVIVLLCKDGYGKTLVPQEFTLDTKIYNHKIIPDDNISGQRLTPYSLDLTQELVILGSGGLMFAAGSILKHNMNPLTEEEIVSLDPMDVFLFDRDTIIAKREMPAADLLLYGSVFLPLIFFAHEDTKKDMGTLAILAGEVFVFQLGLNYMTKVLTQRVRPYCYDEGTPLSEKTTVDAKLSFYSGHTSTTVAMSFFVAKVFSDYLSDPDAKFLIWTSAVLYPFVTGLLRVDSGQHFRTDSTAGFTIGALIGYLSSPYCIKTNVKTLSPCVQLLQIPTWACEFPTAFDHDPITPTPRSHRPHR